MRINHNIAALNTYRQLTANNASSGKSLEKLSSGSRINRAGDDAAGLAISEKMRAQIKGLGMASKNSQDAISLIQTAEGALNETQAILQRMRELAVQSSNDTNVSVDRDQIQKEINQLTSEVNRIGTTTEFNTMKLLNGDKATVTSTSSVTTVGLGSGAKSLNLITSYGVTDANSVGARITGQSISVSSSGDFMTALSGDTAATSLIKISVTSTGLTVELKDTGTAGGTFSATDTVEANSSGDYVYNNHGVSFTITGANYDALSAGVSIQISGLSTANTSVSVANDWQSNTGAVTLTAITTSVASDNQGFYSMKAVFTSGVGTFTFLDSASNTIHEDKIDIVSTASQTFNDHGVSFTWAAAGAASAVFSLTALRTSTTTTNTSTSYTAGLTFQVGANKDQELLLNIEDMRSKALNISVTSTGTSGFRSTAEVSNGENANLVQFALDVSSSSSAAANAITIYNNAINTVSQERSKLGAVQNRLEHTISNLDASAENLQASESRIRDVDMAKEMMEFTKNNILTQAAQSMLAQANQQPQGVLQLLR